jgi:imidazoleglycerol-phosphate dehydratase
MLEIFSKHGLFDLEIKARGDISIDQHHTVEDLGMLLGKAFKESLGDKKGINRAGFFAFPMDDSLGIVAIDLSGRPYLVFKAKLNKEFIGDLDASCVKEFFSGFSMGAGCNIAVYVPYGENEHHKVESIFKAFGKAMKMACSKDKRIKGEIPTTKGILDSL